MNELRFDGRTVVITGAGRGVGRSHALLFAHVRERGRGRSRRQPRRIGFLDRSADEVVKEIEAAGGLAVAC